MDEPLAASIEASRWHPGLPPSQPSACRCQGRSVPFGYGEKNKEESNEVPRHLEEYEGINQQAQDDYAKLFGQTLSDSHLQASLFNWSIPEELEPQEDGVLVV